MGAVNGLEQLMMFHHQMVADTIKSLEASAKTQEQPEDVKKHVSKLKHEFVSFWCNVYGIINGVDKSKDADKWSPKGEFQKKFAEFSQSQMEAQFKMLIEEFKEFPEMVEFIKKLKLMLMEA